MTRTYADAAALARAGVTEIAGYSGGRTRRVCFEERPSIDPAANTLPNIAARAFQTDVVIWHPDGRVTVNLIGPNPEGHGSPGMSPTKLWTTPSTFDAIAAALDISRARVGMHKKVPYCNGADLSGGSHTFEPGGIR